MALQQDYYVARYDVTKIDCYWKVAIENGVDGGKTLSEFSGAVDV